MAAVTTIQLSQTVRDRLKRLASKGETYDGLLRRLLDEVEAQLLYERELRILRAEKFTPLEQV
jgi:hypothetical protein